MLTVANARFYHGAGVYIGRRHPRFGEGSPLANPYPLKVDTPSERYKVLLQYRRWLREQWVQDGPAKTELLRLADQYRDKKVLTLICWCQPQACHGDIVADAIRELVGMYIRVITAPPKLLIAGSREATGEMLDYAQRAVQRAKQRGWQVIVGDAPGVDAAVIEACDNLPVPVTVCGAYGKLRHRSQTGLNLALGSPRFSYTLRDYYMAAECDICLVVWNGTSRGARNTFNAAQRLGKQVHIKSWG